MKSLDQIEPRTAIDPAQPGFSFPYVINTSGSYYVVRNIAATTANPTVINIDADGVTVDLNGYTISSSANPAAGSAILISNNHRDITIRNGHILGGVTSSGGTFSSGPGFVNGITFSNGISDNVRVTDISVQGCTLNGVAISGGSSAIVSRCIVKTVGGIGINADTVDASVAYGTGSYGIACTSVSNSIGYTVSGSVGVSASIAANCFGSSSGAGFGIEANYVINSAGGNFGSGQGINAQNAQNCDGFSTGGTGLSAAVATNCQGRSQTGNGLLATYSAQNCYGNSTGNGTGVNAPLTMNCAASSFSGIGIFTGATTNCSGTSSTGIGISAAIASYCNASTSSGTAGTGLYLMGEASHCNATALGGDGILATDGSAVRNCSVHNSANGIKVGNKCLIEGNSVGENTVGIRVIGASSRFDGNRINCPAGGNAFVFDSTGTNNLIIRNTVRENGTNPFIFNGANNHYGPLINVSSAPADISATANSNYPWANFIY